MELNYSISYEVIRMSTLNHMVLSRYWIDCRGHHLYGGTKGESFMGTLSVDALRKLVVLRALSEFKDGTSYGKKRLQKVLYEGLSGAEYKPVTYQFWNYGQYSADVNQTLDELEGCGLIEKEDTGNGYSVSINDCTPALESVVDKIMPGYVEGLKSAVDEIGYMKDKDIDKWAYNQLEKSGHEKGDVLLEENVSEAEEVPLDESQCQDIELALNTDFVPSVARVIEGMNSVNVDLTPLREWDGPE